MGVALIGKKMGRRDIGAKASRLGNQELVAIVNH